MGRKRLSDAELIRRGSSYYVGYRAAKASSAAAGKVLIYILIFAGMAINSASDMPEIAKKRAIWFRQHGVEVQTKYRTQEAKDASEKKFANFKYGENYNPKCSFAEM